MSGNFINLHDERQIISTLKMSIPWVNGSIDDSGLGGEIKGSCRNTCCNSMLSQPDVYSLAFSVVADL
jgi:hypothetical protein